MNPYISMFNYPYIQQQAQQYHLSQVTEVQKCARALHDFLDSIDNIEPGYQQMASATFSTVILEYLRKHGAV